MAISEAKKVEIKKLALVLAGQHLGNKDPPEVDMWAKATIEAAKRIAPIIADFLYPALSQKEKQALYRW